MPLYTFLNTETDEQFEELMSISAREEYLETNPHIKQIILSAPGIVGGTNLGSFKNDGGWNETLSRIAEAHPNSALADKHGSKSAKETKTKQAVDKWRKTTNLQQ